MLLLALLIIRPNAAHRKGCSSPLSFVPLRETHPRNPGQDASPKILAAFPHFNKNFFCLTGSKPNPTPAISAGAELFSPLSC
jgi:hypothetical protein